MWTWLNWMAARIRALFRAGDDDRDFGLELESHLSMLTEDKIRSGMTAEEARREARLELGGLAQLQQAHRDIRLFPFVDTLLQDLRFGVRMLRRNPGFTLVAIITLSLGIGANTTISSLINSLLLKPIPFPQADRLALVWQSQVSNPKSRNIVSAPNFWDWQRQNDVFENMAVFDTAGKGYDLSGDGEPERVSGVRVSAGFFDTLGVKPRHLSKLLPDDGYQADQRARFYRAGFAERARCDSHQRDHGQAILAG